MEERKAQTEKKSRKRTIFACAGLVSAAAFLVVGIIAKSTWFIIGSAVLALGCALRIAGERHNDGYSSFYLPTIFACLALIPLVVGGSSVVRYFTNLSYTHSLGDPAEILAMTGSRGQRYVVYNTDLGMFEKGWLPSDKQASTADDIKGIFTYGYGSQQVGSYDNGYSAMRNDAQIILISAQTGGQLAREIVYGGDPPSSTVSHDSIFESHERSGSKPSRDKIELYMKSMLKSFEKKTFVALGRYEQDGDADNGPEEILWLEIARQDGKALLLSWCGLDTLVYNDGAGDAAWETCSLRAWLNGDFLASGFTDAERAAILATDVDNGKEQGVEKFETDGGPDTRDQVFLLSSAEMEAYLPQQEDRYCSPSNYAAVQGVSMNEGGNVKWWLRSPGETEGQAAYASANGYWALSAEETMAGIAVRPAMWVDLETLSGLAP